MRQMVVAWAGCLLMASCSEDQCWQAAGREVVQRVDALSAYPAAWIAVEDGIDVVWQESTQEDARAEWHAPSGLLDGAAWGRFADTLVLYDANGCRWLRAPDVHLVCSLYTPSPEGLQMLGHGAFETLDTMRTPESITLYSHRSTAEVNLWIRTDSLAIRIPAGASSWTIDGAVRRAGAYVSGLSQLNADGLETEQFQFHAETNRSQRIRASQYAFVNVAGSGDILLYGQPEAWDEQNAGEGGALLLMP